MCYMYRIMGIIIAAAAALIIASLFFPAHGQTAEKPPYLAVMRVCSAAVGSCDYQRANQRDPTLADCQAKYRNAAKEMAANLALHGVTGTLDVRAVCIDGEGNTGVIDSFSEPIPAKGTSL